MHKLLIDHINKFVELNEDEIALLTSSFKQRRLKKRQFLLNIGDVERVESFITKGCLKTYFIDAKGEEHIVQFGVENWWIGDMYSFLTETPSIYNIEVLEDCELLQIDKETLDRLYIQIPKLERYFRLLIQNAYIASTRRILGTMSKPAEERYLEFLKKFPDIEQRIPQYMVASYLGITPEFLSRIRRKFAGK
jgi:CRP-like cAMP-binding protein